MNVDVDVVVMGGGLAGLTLAMQLKQELPHAKIVVIERSKRPVGEASYKVGESSVEVGAHYFAERLGLKEHLDKDQLPKLGLRFLFPHGDNDDITRRLEIGPSNYPPVPSYQLDRGRFENYLHELNLACGISIYDKARVQAVELHPEDLHLVKFVQDGDVKSVRTRWLVDASGRNKILKRKLGLEKESNLKNGAVWFRLDSEIDITTWSDDIAWRKRSTPSKRFSTNHLMGSGYWVWFIPLASGSTSVGIVFDSKMHDFSEMNSFDKALSWLHKYEPQAAHVIESYRHSLQDFLGFRDYSHSCKQVYSADRWCITGEAGVFVDPFYSPGSDFIAYSNDFVTNLIVRDLAGEDVTQLASKYNSIYLKLSEVVFMIYEGLYPKFGNEFVMTQKILWDSAVYLGVTCLLYFNRKLCDLEFLSRIDADLGRYNDLLYTVADHFKCQPLKHEVSSHGEHVDLSKTFLFGRNLNRELIIKYDNDEVLIEKLRQNIDMLELLAKDIFKNVNIGEKYQGAFE
jgi:flavin-dependent dehydrogenase